MTKRKSDWFCFWRQRWEQMERVYEKRGEEEWRGEGGRRLQTLEDTLEEEERFLSGIISLRGRIGDSRRLVFQLEGGSLGRQHVSQRSFERKFPYKFSAKFRTKLVYK